MILCRVEFLKECGRVHIDRSELAGAELTKGRADQFPEKSRSYLLVKLGTKQRDINSVWILEVHKIKHVF